MSKNIKNTWMAPALQCFFFIFATAILNSCTSGGGGSITGKILQSILVTPANPSVATGAAKQFLATGSYSDGTSADITSTALWSSGTTTVATVNANGLATGVSAGTAEVVAASGGISGNTLLTVLPAPAASGSLDTTFDLIGKVTTTVLAGDDQATSVAIQSDGKIVAAGSASNSVDSSGVGAGSVFALVRYNTDGSLDATFGTSGKVTTAIGISDDIALSVAIQSDGKIVAAGYSYSVTDFAWEIALARYKTDGSLDTTFGTGGKVLTLIGAGGCTAHSVTIQSDNKIVAAGYVDNGANYDFALVRYNPDGSLDTTFGTGGIVTTPIGSSDDGANSVVIQSDNKIVAAGYSFGPIGSGNSFFALVRYNPDGSLDTTFGTGGKLTTGIETIGTNSDMASSVALQSDNKIVAAGYASNDLAVVRYNPDGSLDTTFGTTGKVTTGVRVESQAAGVVVQIDGKIVAAGNSSSLVDWNFGLVRYNADGSLDSTFGAGGKVTTVIGAVAGTIEDKALGILLQPDGKIVAAGYSNNRTNDDFAIVRYWP